MQKYLLALTIALLLSGCDIGKYKDKTAEEWANSYYDENSRRSNLQSEYDSLESEKNDLQDEYDNLQTEYEDLQGCVEDYPHNAEFNCI